VEKALDKVTILVGQLREKLNRVLKYAISDLSPRRRFLQRRARECLPADANGDPIARTER
jgi:hypothetical protein